MAKNTGRKMTLKKSRRIEIVIADAGPLISLARADALETLLVFKDNVSLVITDFVEFEVTRHRDLQTPSGIVTSNKF